MHDFSIIYDLNAEQFDQAYALVKATWWGGTRTRDEMNCLVKNSLSVTLVENPSNQLIGYARILTEEVRYAYIFDVIILEDYRGKGIGKSLMDAIVNHPALKQIKYFELTCKPELKEFYEQFGFSEDYTSNKIKVVPMRFQR